MPFQSMISSRSPSQQLPTFVPTLFYLWVANMSGHLMIYSWKPYQPCNQTKPLEEESSWFWGPSVLPNSLLVLWDTPCCSLKNLPTDTTDVFPSQGTCCNLTDLLNNTAFEPLKSNCEGHSAVEVTRLSWKPEKSLATSAFLFFILRSGVLAQPFLAFPCLTACGISRKYSKVVLTCSFKATNRCMFSAVLCIPFHSQMCLWSRSDPLYLLVCFFHRHCITELLMLFSIMKRLQ